MPNYRVNEDAVAQARELIDARHVRRRHRVVRRRAVGRRRERRDRAAPATTGFGAWHLAIDPDASEETKGRYAFPYGDFATVNRAALILGEQRAAQNDHDVIEKAADDLLEHLDEKRSS